MQSEPPEPLPPPPLHVAIIMDGNGRWGLRRGLTRSDGHEAGADAVRRTVEAAPALGVTTLTLFAFASANWARPTCEVSALMELFRSYLTTDAPRLIEGGARVSMVGRRDRLPRDLARAVTELEAATASNDRLNLRIALDYSSREAIMFAATKLGPAATLAELEHLIVGDPGVGPVDLLIRTGGEQRLSDFMLWECAFAELWFTRRMWPEFEGVDLAEAVADFRGRTRTFGAVIEEGAPVTAQLLPGTRDRNLSLLPAKAGTRAFCARTQALQKKPGPPLSRGRAGGSRL